MDFKEESGKPCKVSVDKDQVEGVQCKVEARDEGAGNKGDDEPKQGVKDETKENKNAITGIEMHVLKIAGKRGGEISFCITCDKSFMVYFCLEFDDATIFAGSKIDVMIFILHLLY